MQVGTYPTRNFARLCYCLAAIGHWLLALGFQALKRSGHFCHSLHVAMQSGLYLFQCALESGVQSLRIPAIGSETSGAKAPSILPPFAARLKSCPSQTLSGLHSRWPFLLIVCTQRVFTLSRSMGYSDFPAYSQILLRLAFVNLRTVIVTAAVHWGFSSKLRLAANLSL